MSERRKKTFLVTVKEVKESNGWSILAFLWFVPVAVAGIAWLFYLGGLSWEQWPPLRWLCIVPTVIAGVPVLVLVVSGLSRLVKWAYRYHTNEK